MNLKKNYCQVHHLYYSGNECPMCVYERSEKLAMKFAGKMMQMDKEKRDKNSSASQESLQKLMDKFNNK